MELLHPHRNNFVKTQNFIQKASIVAAMSQWKIKLAAERLN